MAGVRLAPGVIEELERIIDHLHQHEVEAAEARLDGIISAFDVLKDNPLIGRPAGNDRRELLIGRGAGAYVALYRYLPPIDMALVLAIRAQREAGYTRG
ncbi:type II toxin-antitoxin system RelE/ParE family toxin [Pseudoxanthomonas koreensis]|uniref:type II toxin-antitoxin system RelE/ParE family toxin n=1 Tax=Pseudoxanthomonas koreensis TaxID=266061 RepID=UPI0035A66304